MSTIVSIDLSNPAGGPQTRAAAPGEVPAASAPRVPGAVSKLWLKRVLRRVALGAGSAKDALDAALATQPADIQEDFADATEIARAEPLIEALRAAWGWSPDQVDAVWRGAEQAMLALDVAAAEPELLAAGFALAD